METHPPTLRQPDGGIDALALVKRWHADIAEHHIRVLTFDRLRQVIGVLADGDDVQRRDIGEQFLQRFPDEVAVLGDYQT